MRTASFPMAIVVGLMLSGCNAIFGIEEGTLTGGNGQGGDPGQGGTTTQGGGGNDGGAPQGGQGVGGDPGVGGSGGGVEVCTEDPCKLVAPQCGCGEGEACTLDTTNMRVCRDAGQGTHEQPCDSDGSCAPGHYCFSSTCLAFCAGDDDCQAYGTQCLLSLPSGDRLCYDRCDPTAVDFPRTGCNGQLGCYIAQTTPPTTACAPVGTVSQGQACQFVNDCGLGYGCYIPFGGPRCYRTCVLGAACPVGNCQPLGVNIAGIEYGFCP